MATDFSRLIGLADAAGHLWQARDELAGAGYGGWVGEIQNLIETILLEMRWVEGELENEVNPPRLG
jgi:hypothetical protein